MPREIHTIEADRVAHARYVVAEPVVARQIAGSIDQVKDPILAYGGTVEHRRPLPSMFRERAQNGSTGETLESYHLQTSINAVLSVGNCAESFALFCAEYLLHRTPNSSFLAHLRFTQAGNDPFEPNDTPGQAAGAPLGRRFDAYISRPGDLDYYMLSVWGPSTISVESTQPRDYYLAVLAPDGKTRLAGGDLGFAGERMSVSCDVHQPGTYYVLMKGYSDSEHSMHEPYTMMISVEPRPVR